MIILHLRLYFEYLVIKNWDIFSDQIKDIILDDLTGFNWEEREDGILKIKAELSDLYQLMIILSTRYKIFIN